MPSGITMTVEQKLNNYVPEPNTGCWLWLGAANRDGYGSIRSDTTPMAYRFFYERLVGQIPAGLVLDHKCRVPLCVNPKHLEPVTNRENILRGNGPAAIGARKTHCKNGHALVGTNIQKRSDTERRCLRCRRDRYKGSRPAFCPHGHEYTAANSRIYADGRRRCLACQGRP